MRYAAKYTLEGNPPLLQSSRRPGIGVNAIRVLAARMCARRKDTDVPTTLHIGKDLYPLSRTLREHYVSAFEKAGGTVRKNSPAKMYVDRWDLLAKAVDERKALEPNLEIKVEKVLQEER